MTSQLPEGIVRWGVLMIVNCPQCQARLNIPEDAVTKLVRCAKCRHAFRVHIEANAEPVPETRVAAVPLSPHPTPVPMERRAKRPEVKVPAYLRGLAMLPIGIIGISASGHIFGGGLVGGAVGGAFGGLLVAGCLLIARQTRWPLGLRIPAILGVSLVGYAVALGVAILPRVFGGPWRDFAPPGGGFHVSMPGTPTAQKPPENLSAKLDLYDLQISNPHLEFAVVFGEVPRDEWKRVSLWQRFEDTKHGMLRTLPEVNLVSQKRVGLDGHPGREFQVKVPRQGMLIARYYFANRRMIGLSISGPDVKADSEVVRKFFDSFRIDPPDAEHTIKPEDQPADWDEEDTLPGRRILDYLGEEHDAVTQVAFTPDGRKLVAFRQRRGLVVWDVETRQVEKTLWAATDPHPPFAMNTLLRFAVSPDGQTVAAGVSQGRAELDLFDLATGQKRVELIDGQVNANELWVQGLTFSADGRWLAVANRDGMRVWDVAGQKVARRILRNDVGGGLAFTPDGRSLICGGPNILFLDPLSGGEQRTIHLPRVRDPLGTDSITWLALSADGQRMVTGSFRGGLRLWDVNAGTANILREQGQGTISALDLSPNGKLFVVGDQAMNLHVFDATAKERWHQQFLNPGMNAGAAAAFSPDGRQLALAHSRRLEIWDVEKLIQATPDELTPATRVAPIADAAPPAARPQMVSGIQAHRAGGNVQWAHIQGLLVSPDNSTLITVSMDKTARAWSTATGQPLGQPLLLMGHPKTASGRADGRAFVVAAQDAFNHKEELYLRDLGPADWQDPLAALAKEGSGSRRIKNKGYLFAALTPDGKTLAAATDRKCDLLNWNDLIVRAAFPPSGFEIHFLAVSPDGNTVAVAGKQDPNIHLFDARTGKERQKLEAHRDGVRALAYSPNGKLLAATLANNRIALWDPSAGKAADLPSLTAPKVDTLGDGSLAFSADSTLLAAGGWAPDGGNGKAVLWDAATGQELTAFAYFSKHAPITALTFTPDGSNLIAGSADGYVNLWPITNFRRGK
jgi:predicted Zn finger-like uncharacterized protein